MYKSGSAALPFSSCCIDPAGYNTRRKDLFKNLHIFFFSSSSLTVKRKNGKLFHLYVSPSDSFSEILRGIEGGKKAEAAAATTGVSAVSHDGVFHL